VNPDARPVELAVIGDSGEALLLRALLESLGQTVLTHFIGQPNALFPLLNRRRAPPALMILSGHGDDTGLVFGDFADGIDTGLLQAGCLPAQALRGKVALKGSVLVSTACCTGSPAFADLFVKAGVGAYLAPPGDPDGADVPLILHHFFHGWFAKGLSPRLAWSDTLAALRGAGQFAMVP